MVELIDRVLIETLTGRTRICSFIANWQDIPEVAGGARLGIRLFRRGVFGVIIIILTNIKTFRPTSQTCEALECVSDLISGNFLTWRKAGSGVGGQQMGLELKPTSAVLGSS